MQYSENLNFNLPEMTDPPDISKLIENWSNLDPIIQNIIIGLTQVGNAAKVNGYTVNANVPEGAKFTDTVTTVNGKTGAITKADIVALGIPASDTNTTYAEITTSEIDAGTSSTLRTITGRRVKYILDKVQGWIDGLQTALDGKVNTSQVLTNVPAGAVFTDTVTTINGKTGAITKADIVALGIPAQDTNTTYSNATTSAAGLMSAADKTKLDGVATGANNYSHPTSAGNKHIPSGGASGNLLGYSASGTAQWVDPSTINAGQVDGKSIWVGAEGSKGTNANTIYFCY